MANEIEFESEFTVTKAEKAAYIEAVEKAVAEQEGSHAVRMIEAIKLSNVDGDPDACSVSVKLHGRNFERIRRITGYLVGTVDRWNDAKRAELKDRVKHAA